MRPLAVVIAAVLMLGPLGCAHRVTTPTVAAEPKPDVGRVGLIVASGPAATHFDRPEVVGRAQGAKAGAIAGAVAPLMPAAGLARCRSGADLFLGLAILAAGLALAPVGAGVGAVAGAVAAPPKDEVGQSAEALERALARLNLPGVLPAWIIAAARERPIVLVADAASPVVDTFLELAEPDVWLSVKDRSDWKMAFSPALTLRLVLRARLVRALDGEEIRTVSWEHEGPTAAFVHWGKDDARQFRVELERAGRALAAKVVADLY